MADPIETKLQDLIDTLRANRRPSDWETRMRMFAGNDRRVLDRIPLVRHKVAVENNLLRTLEEQLEAVKRANAQLH